MAMGNVTIPAMPAGPMKYASTRPVSLSRLIRSTALAMTVRPKFGIRWRDSIRAELGLSIWKPRAYQRKMLGKVNPAIMPLITYRISLTNPFICHTCVCILWNLIYMYSAYVSEEYPSICGPSCHPQLCDNKCPLYAEPYTAPEDTPPNPPLQLTDDKYCFPPYNSRERYTNVFGGGYIVEVKESNGGWCGPGKKINRFSALI